MKQLPVIMMIAAMLITGCGSSNKLDEKAAFAVLKDKMHFPRMLSFDVNCVDPGEARRLLNSAAENEGLITIQRTQKMRDIGKPLIYFTDKAAPYLLPTPEAEKGHMQKVKLVDEELTEVTAVTNNEADKSAVVEYTTVYKNITPFAAVYLKEVNAPKTNRVFLSLHGNEWRVEKKRGFW